VGSTSARRLSERNDANGRPVSETTRRREEDTRGCGRVRGSACALDIRRGDDVDEAPRAHSQRRGQASSGHSATRSSHTDGDDDGGGRRELG